MLLLNRLLPVLFYVVKVQWQFLLNIDCARHFRRRRAFEQGHEIESCDSVPRTTPSSTLLRGRHDLRTAWRAERKATLFRPRRAQPFPRNGNLSRSCASDPAVAVKKYKIHKVVLLLHSLDPSGLQMPQLQHPSFHVHDRSTSLSRGNICPICPKCVIREIVEYYQIENVHATYTYVMPKTANSMQSEMTAMRTLLSQPATQHRLETRFVILRLVSRFEQNWS